MHLLSDPRTLDLARHLILFSVLIVSLYTDLAEGRVDNFCSYGGIVVGLLIHGLAGGWGRGGVMECLRNPGALGLLNALLGAGAAFALFFPFFWMGGFGGGDLKLMTAVGALAGLRVTLTALVLTATVGAAMALALLIWKGRLGEGLRGSWSLLRHLGKNVEAPAAKLSIRYVPAIAAGTLWAWWVHYV